VPAKAKPQPEVLGTRPTSITAVVDCPGALASGSLHGNLYLYDTKRAEGSAGFGTEELRTRVRKGDQLLWNVIALECETYVSIDGIVIDEQVCVPEKRVYPGTDISFWFATIQKEIPESVPYQIRFLLGSRTTPITTTVSPALIR
jgi:hypothetical protein